MTKTDMMVSKTFSARFIMAVMFSFTACYGFIIGKLPSEAFMSLVGATVTAYFMKGKDDDTTRKEGSQEVTGSGSIKIVSGDTGQAPVS